MRAFSEVAQLWLKWFGPRGRLSSAKYTTVVPILAAEILPSLAPVKLGCMLRVKLLRPDAKAPTIAHPGEDLGYDLYAAESVTIASRGNAVVPTGVAIQLTSAADVPMGALVRDRSSMAARRLTVTAGVIDAGYRGEIKVIMENLGDTAAEIHAGDKLANLIPYPVLTTAVEVVEDLSDSKRGAGGFGSSGR